MMTKTKQYQNWHVENDKDQIAWLRFDRAHSDINTINVDVLNELSAILTDISQRAKVAGVVIASAKSSGFIAGADVEQFMKFKTVAEAMELIWKGQEVYNQLAALQLPTVAMIQGFCLGGGCEMVLACRYRVAEDNPKTKIGLPEILSGSSSRMGGSVRLPRLEGVLHAMDLILSGRTVTAKVAVQMGLVGYCST